MSGSRIATAASEGFKDAAAYDAHRPAYPPEAVDALLEKMHLAPPQDQMNDAVGGIGSSSSTSNTASAAANNHDIQEVGGGAEAGEVVRIVEIAAGTGKFTEALVAAAGRARRRRHQVGETVEPLAWGKEDLGLEVLATEPHADMLRELKEKQLPGVVVRRAAAEEVASVINVVAPLRVEEQKEKQTQRDAEGWADGVIAAQAFHWFATDQVLEEIHKILKPGGVFGMIWNIDDFNKPKAWEASTHWEQHLNDWIVSLSANDDNKRFRDMAWQDVFTNQLKTNPLSVLKSIVVTHDLPKFSVPLGEDEVKYTHWLSEEALWKRINTLSQVVMLKGAEKERGRKLFEEAMAMDDVKRNEKGEIECHGRTYFAWTDRV